MIIHRRGAHVVIHAPAKLNLLLEVLGKREDGFHEIETIMAPIGLFDTLEFTDQPAAAGLSLACDWSCGLRAKNNLRPEAVGPANLRADATVSARHLALGGELPEGTDNLVIRAVERVRAQAGIAQGARLRLVKRIPAAAGLGGASSDAAAALVAANLVWRLGWSQQRLSQLAAELGSDVPFFLQGRTAICRGRGERIEPLAGIGPMHLVLVKPPVGLATPAVYRNCRPAEDPVDAARLIEGLRTCPTRAARWMINRLQPAAERLTPWIDRLRTEFERLDCAGHQMTGSGTSYFGLCHSARHARRVAGQLLARRVGHVWAVRTLSRVVAAPGLAQH